MESKPKIIPLPLEVVEIILSHLSEPDLLTCRLVNQDWNKECLRQLRKSKGRKLVMLPEIPSVLEFLTKSSANTHAHAELWVLPFKLYLDFTQIFNIQFNSIPIQIEEPSSTELKKIGDQVNALVKLAPGSVFDVDIRGYWPSRENTFRTWAKILSKCSPHLRNLSFYLQEGSTTTTPITMSMAVKNFRHEHLTFQNLKSLSIGVTLPMNEYGLPNLEKTFTNEIIQQSPNLEQLNIGNSVHFDKEVWAVPVLHKLKKWTVCHLLTGRFDLMKRVPSPRVVPNLDSLHLVPNTRQFEDEQQTHTIRTILVSFSARLRILAIDNFPLRRNDLIGDTPNTVTPIKFPALPCLEHLRVGLVDNEFTQIFANLEEFNFSQGNFPALKSVDIELGFYWAIWLERGATFQAQAFDTVHRLRILVTLSTKDFSLNSVQEYMVHVQGTFPNVNHLSLYIEWNPNILSILEGIFGSERAPQIHTFELKTWFGHRLSDAVSGISTHGCSASPVPPHCGRESGEKLGRENFALPTSNMTNVTKFRLKSTHQYVKEHALRWFVEQFPSLAQIELFVQRRWRAEQEECSHFLKQFPSHSSSAPAIKVELHDYNLKY